MSMISGTSVRTTVNGVEPSGPGSLVRLVSESASDPRQWLWWLGAIGCFALFRQLFLDNLDHFYNVWSKDENYSHGFLFRSSACILPIRCQAAPPSRFAAVWH